MDKNGQKIDTRGVPVENISVKGDGKVTLKIEHNDPNRTPPTWTENVEAGQIAIVKFRNRQGLEAAGANKFIQTNASGEATEDTTSKILQGYQ